MALFTSREFIDILMNMEQHETLYVLGGFGLIASPKNKTRVKNAQSFNRSADRAKMIDNASEDTWFFDCIGMVKAALWGWHGNASLSYGGAVYKSNGVPDTNCEGMIKLCHDVSKDFSNIEPGEFLYMKGHCGIYVGDGLCIECTPKWDNKIQYSYLGNIGCTAGHSRIWTSHGKLPWVEYLLIEKQPTLYTAKRGDSISKLMKQGVITDKAAFIKANNLKYPYWLYEGRQYKL